MATDNRIGRDSRLDRTPGTFRISESPFKSAPRLVTALTTKTGKPWVYKMCYIGGRGDVPCAIEIDGDGLKTLWQDASGRWWLEYKVCSSWLPDTEATLALLKREVAVNQDAEVELTFPDYDGKPMW